jgi:hypothetical protein
MPSSPAPHARGERPATTTTTIDVAALFAAEGVCVKAPENINAPIDPRLSLSSTSGGDHDVTLAGPSQSHSLKSKGGSIQEDISEKGQHVEPIYVNPLVLFAIDK